MPDAPNKTRPKMPIPVIRPSGTHKKPLPPGVDPNEALRMSQTQVFRPKAKGEGEGGSPIEAAQPAANPGASGVSIQIAASSVIPNLPDTLVDPNKLSAAQVPEKFSFDAAILLPQLATGRIAVPLELIIGQIGGEITRAGANKKEGIRLPLPEVVANIPPEMLTVEGQVVQEIDPNFVESPFAEGKLGGKPAEVKIIEPPRPEPQVPQPPPQLGIPAPVEPPKPSVRVESPAEPIEAPTPAAAEPAVVSAVPTTVRLFLVSLLKRLPDDLFAMPKEQCMQEAGESVIEIPIDILLPKLATGRVSLEYAVLHPFFPQNMVIGVNSANKGAEILLPLDRIVSQIPPEMMKVEGVQKMELPDDSMIPSNLFTEKGAAAPAAPAAAGLPAPAPSEAAPAPAPVPAENQRPAEPKDLEICPTAENFDEAALLDRVNRLQEHELTELNGIGIQLARKILEQRERAKTLSFQDLKDLGVRRKSLLRLASMPDPGAGAVNVGVLNRLLTLTDQRTLKVQEIIDTAVAKFGVVAGMMVAEDGLVLAGNPPEGFDKQMISAFIPQIFRHLARGIEPAGAGKVSRVTIVLEKHLVSLFRAQGIFLLFWHARDKMNREFFKRAERLTEELSRQNLSAA